MKKHQFRYVLSFLILTLFTFATLVDSQESTEQITEETNPTEQSSTDQSTEESKLTEQSSVESNPTGSQFNTLKDDFEMLQYSFSALEDSSANAFQIFVIIIVAFIILISVFVIFWGRHLVRQQQSTLDESERRWNGKLDDSLQRSDGRLTLIRQQGDERTQKLEEIESNQSMISDELKTFQNIIAGIESRLDNLNSNVANLESEIETNITSDSSVVYQVDVESTVFETQTRLEELARAYRDGEPIDLDYIETPIPSHNVVLNINWIARTIGEWITELELSTAVNQSLIQTLKYAEQIIKDKLNTIREESMPTLKPFNLETNMELGDIRDQSITYPTRLEGVLIGYELGRRADEAGLEQFIPQFIKNQLFNNVITHMPHGQLPEQLVRFLQLAEYEVIPIEIGITEADSRFHEIQDSKHTGVKRGTVAEVIRPGLMQKTDRSIVQKPVVIRGE